MSIAAGWCNPCVHRQLDADRVRAQAKSSQAELIMAMPRG
jgi:hypothetical protein